MQTQTDVGARVLHVTRHPLQAGERERQAGILERNANLMVRFGADRPRLGRQIHHGSLALTDGAGSEWRASGSVRDGFCD